MAQKRMGGQGAGRMKPALDFAKENGFEITFTKKQHVVFRLGDGRVTASGTPRHPENVKRVLGQLRRVLNAVQVGDKPPQDAEPEE